MSVDLLGCLSAAPRRRRGALEGSVERDVGRAVRVVVDDDEPLAVELVQRRACLPGEVADAHSVRKPGVILTPVRVGRARAFSELTAFYSQPLNPYSVVAQASGSATKQ
jgi:hypothetical protein